MYDKINLKFLIDLEQKGEEYTLDWLMKNDLILNKINCSKCGKLMKQMPTNCFLWACRNRSLSKGQYHSVLRSVRRDTIFGSSRLHFSLLLQMIYLWIKNCTNEFIADELHVGKQTVTDWKKLCREICKEICLRENVMLGGFGIIIELFVTEFDTKTKLGSKKFKCKYICGGVERGTNKLFLKVVSNNEQNNLLDVIQENIVPGSIIYSDCWEKYNYFNSNSVIVQLNQDFVLKNPETNADVETIHTIWNIFKDRLLMNSHGANYFDLFLDEFLWLKRHEEDPDGIFISFIKASKEICKPEPSD